MFVVVSGGGSEFAGLSEWVCLDVSCREFNPKFPICEKQKNRENTRQKKTITCTKQYLRGLAICLYPRSCRNFTIIREKYKVWQYSFSSLSKKQRQTLITKVTFSTSCTQESPK